MIASTVQPLQNTLHVPENTSCVAIRWQAKPATFQKHSSSAWASGQHWRQSARRGDIKIAPPPKRVLLQSSKF